jgi:phenylalanyl-tRNA synthetase beta chain
MPVINLQAEKLAGFLGKPVSVEELTKWLPWLGFDLEEVGKDYIKVEYNPNRMDFCSHVGVARALKGFLELETGMPKYQAEPPKVTLNIDSSVSSVRPYMLAAVVRDIKLDEDAIIELMEMQEDLHWGIGRNRRKASIGIHNLDAVEPPFTYMAVEPTSVKFVPLGKTEEMTPKEILEKHEKGIAYRHLIDWAPRYPLLVDRHGRVLSMPPIINGELTRVDEKTRNLFLDVTGPSIEAVERSLKILATTLADMGGRLEKGYDPLSGPHINFAEP